MVLSPRNQVTLPGTSLADVFNLLLIKYQDKYMGEWVSMQIRNEPEETTRFDPVDTGGKETLAWIAYTPSDPSLVPALISTIVRFHEEFEIKRTMVLGFHHGKTGANWQKGVKEELESCCPRLSKLLETGFRQRPPQKAVNWAEVIHSQLKSLGKDARVIFSATPASRMLAAEGGLALGRLLAREPDKYAMAYVDFFWGQWRGLYYPLIPRAAHPIHIARPGYLETHARVERELPRKILPTGTPIRVMGRNLSVLREGVTRLALALNRVTPPGLWALSGDSLPRGPEVEFSLIVGGVGSYEEKITLRHAYEVDSWIHALRAARDLLNNVAQDAGGGEETFQLYGLAGLNVMVLHSKDVVGSDSGRLTHLGNEVIVDTNMIYNGVHNDALLGARVVVPECAVAEVHRRYAEALKKRQHSRRALDLLAFTALQETLGAGAVVAPSPSPPCDTAIPNINPLILGLRFLATLDEGARRYWVWHPSTRGESVLDLRLHDLESSSWERGEPLYALLQSLIVAGIYAYYAQGQRVEPSVSVAIACREREERVNLGKLAEKLLHPPSFAP